MTNRSPVIRGETMSPNHRRGLVMAIVLLMCTTASDPVRAQIWTAPSAPQTTDPFNPAQPWDPYFAATPGLPEPWTWQLLPDAVLFQEFAADPRASRLNSSILYERDKGWLWELEAGARVGILRWGTVRNQSPEGWQLDAEGSAFPRLDLNNDYDLENVDFKAGLPLTYRQGPWQFQAEIYHLSSHLGDEFLIANPGVVRVNYVRDAFTLGAGYFVTPDLRLYGEAEYAFNTDGGAEPFHFQAGFEYSRTALDFPGQPTPFVAANVSLREEVDFGGGINVIAGYEWLGSTSDRKLRVGLQYYNGKSFQYSIFDEHEELLGFLLQYEF